ncbi:uncharacterized protein FTOL_02361 [Fusarium torulosum]|uniref:Uncharacterized protein n=1 Tax=Fusarium torulosum TaxID=33205 RepID=A0AAE8SEI5_9HYPO|nr:uncharacterized protein FTOL_02361 [Fusarium torulosum]
MLMQKAITVREGQLHAQKYPLLLDIVVQGKYDRFFMFTHHDDFENIFQNCSDFFNHKFPGGLKVCLTTAFGRAQERAQIELDVKIRIYLV